MSIDAAVEGALKRDRIAILAALSTVIVISWTYVLAGAGMCLSAFKVTRMTSGCLGHEIRRADVFHVVGHDGRHDATLGGTHGASVRGDEPQRKEKGNAWVPTSLFASAYLIAWAGFSVVAVGTFGVAVANAGWCERGARRHLIAGWGIYQLRPLKRACLRHCHCRCNSFSLIGAGE